MRAAVARFREPHMRKGQDISFPLTLGARVFGSFTGRYA
jgi:hypothetical protein